MKDRSCPGFIHIIEYEIAQKIIDQMTKQDKKSFLRITEKLNINGWGGIDPILLFNEMENRLKIERIRNVARKKGIKQNAS